MKNLLLVAVLLTGVFLIGCDEIDVSSLSDDDLERIADTAIVCERPYMRFGMDCCLDQDDNAICDVDEQEPTEREDAEEEQEESEDDEADEELDEVEESEEEDDSDDEIEEVRDNEFLGEEDAPVTVIEWSDFECPFCARFYSETLPQIIEEYVEEGDVKFVFKHFPLSFHKNAQKAAEAAECAKDQGAFWEMHDLLFESGVDGGEKTYKKYAAQLDLDEGKFASCLNSGRKAKEIDQDIKEGTAAGVRGTPGFTVNGQLVSGAQPFAAFEAVIEEKLDS